MALIFSNLVLFLVYRVLPGILRSSPYPETTCAPWCRSPRSWDFQSDEWGQPAAGSSRGHAAPWWSARDTCSGRKRSGRKMEEYGRKWKEICIFAFLLGVDCTCVSDVQFECAANSLLQWHAFLMCRKICVLSALCENALHAALRAFLMCDFIVRF